jgi:putative membrane protein
MMLIHSIGLSVPTVCGLIVPFRELMPVFLTTLLFVLLGLVIFALAFVVIAKVAPFSVRKELEEDQNIALAIVIAAVILGSAMIIAAAING